MYPVSIGNIERRSQVDSTDPHLQNAAGAIGNESKSLPAPQLPLTAFRSINCRSNRAAPSYSRTTTASEHGNLVDSGCSNTHTALSSQPMCICTPLSAASMPQQAVAFGAITSARSTAETMYDGSEDSGGEKDGVAEAASKVVKAYCGKCRQTVVHYENPFRCTVCYRD